MATRARRARALPRILMLLLLILFLVVAGILWFDILGVVDARSTVLPLLKMVGFAHTDQPLDADDPLLLDKERLKKREEALTITKDELEQRKQELDKMNEEVQQKENSLAEKEKAQDDREKSFNEMTNQYENKNANLDQNAAYLTGMPPEKAVKILESMDEVMVVSLLRKVEERAKAAGETSLVSVWLSQMEATKAASIQRKLARASGG